MIQLPVELRRLCIELLNNDASSLKSLRLANKEIGELAAEILFRTAVLKPTDDSAATLTELMHSQHNHLVRCVVIDLFPESGYEPEDESELLESVTEAIGSLSSFANLEHLQLRFDEDCADSKNDFKDVAQESYFRNDVLETVFEALKDVSTLEVLSIRDLQDLMDRTVLQSEAFQSVRRRLNGLHLQIVTEVVEQFDLDFEALHQGFTVDLPELWLKPVSSHLRHLTLYSYTCMWGLYPFVDFREVGTFPCLESLSLGNFTIAHDWQIEWIMSHGRTLKQLLLDDCPIITALKMKPDDNMAKLNFPGLQADSRTMTNDGRGYFSYIKTISMRWHYVFDLFRSGLPHLQHFALCSSNRDWADDSFDHRYNLMNRLLRNRYYMFDRGSIPHFLEPEDYRPTAGHHDFYLRGAHPDSEYLRVEFPMCDDEDAEALEKLMKIVNHRARTAL